MKTLKMRRMRKDLQPEEEWNEREKQPPDSRKWSMVVMSSDHPMEGAWRQTGICHPPLTAEDSGETSREHGVRTGTELGTPLKGTMVLGSCNCYLQFESLERIPLCLERVVKKVEECGEVRMMGGGCW